MSFVCVCSSDCFKYEVNGFIENNQEIIVILGNSKTMSAEINRTRVTQVSHSTSVLYVALDATDAIVTVVSIMHD